MKTVTLWRPVGQAELDLIAKGNYLAFPPRLESQPIFYPVCNEEYAMQITIDWNARKQGIGYVMQFEIDADFISQYDVHVVGSKIHAEYWIPAEDLCRFNCAIVGPIDVSFVYEVIKEEK
jgi:hypothetical protein